jgi:signal transduction histidine kinase
MLDDYQIPAIALIAAMMLAFSYLHSRFRSVRTLLWMLALGCAEVQALLLWMISNWAVKPGAGTPPAIQAMSAAAETALMLSSAFFLASLSSLSFPVGRMRVLFVFPYIVPVLLYVGLYFGVSQHPTGPLLQLYIFLAYSAVGAAFFWSLQKGEVPTWIAAPVVLLGGIVSAPFFLQGNVYWPLLVVESGNMLMSALLVIFCFRRLSPGVFLATSGFVAWALPPFFLMQPADKLGITGLMLTRIAILGKVVLAIGLILLVLEDEVEKNETAQRRERRVRMELEAYARQSLTARSLEDFDRESSQLCALIAEQSPFASAGLIVRTASGAFTLVGYAGFDGATAGALDALAQRLPVTCFTTPDREMTPPSDELASHATEDGLAAPTQDRAEDPPTTPSRKTPSSAPGHTGAFARILVPESSLLDLDLKPWFTPGDDLERLGLTRISAIPLLGPLLSPDDSAEGALLLTAPRSPIASLHADDLLPLEILAGRLQAARAQALMLGKLIDSERFAGVGQLASNVAQQLNNPLTVILGYSALLEDSASNLAESRGAEAISVEARRMKAILARLSRFSRLSTERFNSFSVADLVADIEQMHRTDFLRHSIEFRLTVAPDIPPIFGNAHQIRQALLHATQYAIDSAMRVGPNVEKSVRIEAGTSHSEDGRVEVLIAHSGQGFAHPERAFESLSSGFAASETTGIGLSLSAAIVREHRGNITAVNYEPTGAGVILSLPVS